MRVADSIQFDHVRNWKQASLDAEGYLLTAGYRWFASINIFGFHFMLGRSAYERPYPHSRLWCLLHGGHDEQINNLSNPARRWYCPACGTIWHA